MTIKPKENLTENLPLKGIRIIDLSMVWAGPYCARLLADLGAEVIKIESSVRYDGTRGAVEPKGGIYPDNLPGERPYNRSGYFNKLNRNKLGVSLSLNKPKGVELFKRLVSMSDVVVEAYSPRVMHNFGLDYEALCQVKQDLIMVSMPGFGTDGPYRDYVAFGAGIEAMVGLTSMTGYREGPPTKSGVAYPDPIAGAHAAFAILTALHYRRRTGVGQYIDLAQRQTALQVVGEQVANYAVNRVLPERSGNENALIAPQGCYRCTGDDAWVAISIETDEEWRKFCVVMDRPELAEDIRFLTMADRLARLRELDAIIAGWTANLENAQVFNRLQSAGISAGPVFDAGGLFADPHLESRGFFVTIEHPEAGKHRYPGAPFGLSANAAIPLKPAPCFGEHNDHIYQDLLQLSDEEIAALSAEGVITWDLV